MYVDKRCLSMALFMVSLLLIITPLPANSYLELVQRDEDSAVALLHSDIHVIAGSFGLLYGGEELSFVSIHPGLDLPPGATFVHCPDTSDLDPD